MKVDTLFLSGGGVHCIAFLGSLKYLINNGIIKHDLSNIKTIICVSGGILHIIPILLGYSIESTIRFFTESDYFNLNDWNDISINSIFTNYGLYTKDFLSKLISPLLKKKNLPNDITLKQLFTISKIKLIIKTVNITTRQILYLHHKNHPDLPLVTAIKMTTCFPLFFEPILYNDQYYVDGGLCGNFPLEYKDRNKTKFKNFIGIKVMSSKEEKLNDIFDYLSALYNIAWSPYDHITKKRIIEIPTEGSGMDFSITKEQKIKMIENGISQVQKIIDP